MKNIVRSKIFQNTAWILAGNASIAVISFISALVVARFLGPESYGELQVAISYFVLFQNFENIINPSIFKKVLIESPEDTSDLISNLGSLITVLGIVLGLFSLIIFVFFDSKTTLLISIMLLGMVFRYSNGISFYYDSKLESKRTVLIQNSGYLISSCLRAFFAIISPSLLLQAIIIPTQYIWNCLLHIYDFKQVFKKELYFILSPTILKPILLLSLPLFLSSFIEILSNRIGIFFIDAKLGKLDVGIFSAAVKLSEPWLIFGAAISSSFWPQIIKLKKNGSSEYDFKISVVYGLLFYISIAICICTLFFSDIVVYQFLGPKYVNSLPILKVHIISVLFLNWSFFTGLWEINEGLTKFTLAKNIIALVINVVGCHYFINHFGIVGASYSAVISYFFISTLGCIFNKRSRRLLLDQIKSPAAVITFLAGKFNTNDNIR